MAGVRGRQRKLSGFSTVHSTIAVVTLVANNIDSCSDKMKQCGAVFTDCCHCLIVKTLCNILLDLSNQNNILSD